MNLLKSLPLLLLAFLSLPLTVSAQELPSHCTIPPKPECAKDVAVFQKDASYCDYATTDFSQADCFLAVAIATHDIDLCSGKASANRDSCIKKIAESESNIDYCELIEYEGMRDDCFSSIGKKTNDISHCRRISSGFYRASCTTTVAVNTRDVSLCDDLNGSNKYDCLRDIAVKNRDVEYCATATDGDYCFRRMAIEHRDPALCRKIEDTKARGECISSGHLSNQNTYGPKLIIAVIFLLLLFGASHYLLFKTKNEYINGLAVALIFLPYLFFLHSVKFEFLDTSPPYHTVLIYLSAMNFVLVAVNFFMRRFQYRESRSKLLSAKFVIASLMPLLPLLYFFRQDGTLPVISQYDTMVVFGKPGILLFFLWYLAPALALGIISIGFFLSEYTNLNDKKSFVGLLMAFVFALELVPSIIIFWVFSQFG